jgi:tetratricopeptide (TPR) repeat protein
MKRRSLKALEDAAENANSRSKKALAMYELALFHDNNSREAEAVPIYQRAIRLGLDRKHEAMARAWLASSLFKTDRPAQALKQISSALKLARHPGLRDFLFRLRKRIGASLR